MVQKVIKVVRDDLDTAREIDEAECDVIQAAIDYIAKRDAQVDMVIDYIAKRDAHAAYSLVHQSEEGKYLNHCVKELLKVRNG